tara:strand:- start:189 stop:989 length:801 start_codon:yes stop_codon:yes gene_type:complete
MSIILGTQLSNVAAQTTLDLQGLITSMQVSGMSNTAIKASLMADLTGGGRIFGNYRNQVKNTVKSGVSMAGSNASKDIFTKAGVEKFRWQTVQGDTVCPDCEPRHGQIESMKVWEMIGTPQSGFSVCQQYCQCQLIAADYKGENLDKPLVRGKKRIAPVLPTKKTNKAQKSSSSRSFEANSSNDFEVKMRELSKGDDKIYTASITFGTVFIKEHKYKSAISQSVIEMSVPNYKGYWQNGKFHKYDKEFIEQRSKPKKKKRTVFGGG